MQCFVLERHARGWLCVQGKSQTADQSTASACTDGCAPHLHRGLAARDRQGLVLAALRRPALLLPCVLSLLALCACTFDCSSFTEQGDLPSQALGYESECARAPAAGENQQPP